MATPTPPNGNPANAPGAVVSNVPHRGVVAAQRARAGRSETARLIAAGQMNGEAAKPSVPPPGTRASSPPPAETPPTPEATPDATPEAETETRPEAETPAAPDVPPVDDKPDAETAKRLATIQSAEKRQREKAAAAHAEIDERVKKLEREWSPRIKAAEDFEALKRTAEKSRSNPALLVDVLKTLGYGEEHLEGVARAAYAYSKAGAADPNHKAYAERLLRDRETVDETSALRRRLDELEGKLTAKEQQTEFQRLQTGYLDEAVKAIGDDSPTVKAMTAGAKNPAKLRAALWRHTEELTRENDGDMPEFSDVVKRYQAELDEMGVPRPVAAAPAKTDDKKQNNQPADKQTPAKTLSADLSTPRVPRDAQSSKDHRAETRRLIAAGKLQ